MLPESHPRKNRVWPGPVLRLAAALLLACVGLSGRAAAQAPPCPTTISGFPPALPPPPEKPPRPPSGKESVGDFVEGLSNIDSAFEVILGQSRILTTKEDLAATGKAAALIAIGDPAVIDFTVLSARQLRVIGRRIGVTDLSVTTSDRRTYTFEVRVVADLQVLRGQLQCLFPDASLKLSQIRDHIVVEGQARDATQVGRIVETIRYYLASVQNSQARPAGGAGQPGRPGVGPGRMPPAGPVVGPLPEELPLPPGYVSPELAPPLNVQGSPSQPQVINLIRVPTTQQVLLKVRVAELNRTGIRQIGADWFIGDRDSGSVFGTQIGNGTVSAQGIIGENGGIVTNRNQIRTFFGTSPNTTIFGVFEGPSFETLVRALRRNQLLKILAEPNLVAMNGHQASFLAGGEFPVPIPMTTTGGAGTSVTVTFKEFGVRLGFVPTILDNDTIRLVVDPEVSTIDFSIGVIIVPGGSPVPGLNTRKAHTTVELRQGQTLAMAGLLQVTLDSQTSRIPGLGDLPYIGPLFSNTTGQRTEKELLILVTPYLVEPMNPGQVPPAPGDEVNEPNDLEFYFLNRIEGRTGRDVRSTVNYDDPLHILRCFLKMEKEHVNGPHGFCD